MAAAPTLPAASVNVTLYVNVPSRSEETLMPVTLLRGRGHAAAAGDGRAAAAAGDRVFVGRAHFGPGEGEAGVAAVVAPSTAGTAAIV